MRRSWTAIALVAAAAILGASVLGARALADDGSDGSGTDKTITVTSTASVGSEPDEAVVTLGVTTQDPDSATALGRNGDTVDAVVAAVEGAGVAKDDVRTTRLDLNRRTIHRRTPQETTVFVADSALEITVRDMDAVGDVIQAGVEAGATSVRGVRFGVSDPAEARTEALDAAVRGRSHEGRRDGRGRRHHRHGRGHDRRARSGAARVPELRRRHGVSRGDGGPLRPGGAAGPDPDAGHGDRDLGDRLSATTGHRATLPEAQFA